MQLNYVYLYRNQLDIFTNYNQSWTQERYRKVYNRNLKIYRSVDNTIDFTVRNGSQKEISLGNATTVVFNLISNTTEKLVLQKDCTVLDITRGRHQVIITEQELFDLDPGFYSFYVVAETRSNIDSTTYEVTSKQVLYTDDQYDGHGSLQILEGVTGQVANSEVIKNFNLIDPAATGSEELPRYTSSIIHANYKTTMPNSIHTFQFYLNNYTGSVVIQGSLDEGSSPDNWSDLEVSEYTDQNTNVYKNIIGKYNWFRIVHTPNETGAQASFVIAQTIAGSYTVSVREGGIGYSVGNTITINGDELGGETPANDLIITVDSVNDDGEIEEISFTGVSYNGVRTFVKSGVSTQVGSLDKILYR